MTQTLTQATLCPNCGHDQDGYKYATHCLSCGWPLSGPCSKPRAAKATPGPWEVSAMTLTRSLERAGFAHGFNIEAPHLQKVGMPKRVCELLAEYGEKQETEANAKLIAAAPLLLQALQDLKRELHAANLKLNVRKHFSLLSADAQAGTAIHRATT